MAEEAKKSTTKKSATKKSTSKATTTKKPATKKTTTTTKKAPSSTAKKSTTTRKTTPRKTTTSTETKTKKTTTKKSVNESKITPKRVKKDNKSSNLTSQEVKTMKKTPQPKPSKKVKKQEDLNTFETLEQAVEHKEITEKEPLGKTFYLIFGLVAYAGAFFYINNILYDNGDIVQSAVFAFAAVFIMFVLMLFNVHMIVINYFYLPFKRLFKQTRKEIHQEIIFSVGKNKVQTSFNKYKSLFTLILYFLFAGALIYFSVMGSIQQGDKILKLVTDATATLLIFLAVVCSWQYLFNIIPSILDKSIDARNGFILTLSGVVLAIYVVFLLLDILYLAEIMIFLLIIGFVALLGVNLNMIIGEINIFQNLRGRKSKAITRIVFIVFFGFHIYVIVYASVVAYSIYNWQPESFVFSSYDTEKEIITDLSDSYGYELEQVYWKDESIVNLLDPDADIVPLDTVYDKDGTEITEFYDENLVPVRIVYDSNGNVIPLLDENGLEIDTAVYQTHLGDTVCNVFYNDGTFACSADVPQLHTYGDFLYWTVVTVSTIGYGDIHPSTEYNIAMGWGGFLGMYGLTFFALSISFVSNIAMEGINSVREENRKND